MSCFSHGKFYRNDVSDADDMLGHKNYTLYKVYIDLEIEKRESFNFLLFSSKIGLIYRCSQRLNCIKGYEYFYNQLKPYERPSKQLQLQTFI